MIIEDNEFKIKNKMIFKIIRRAALSLCFLTGAALAEPVELKFGHAAGANSLKGLSADEFARRVNNEMADRAHVTVYGSSQLGKDREMLKRLRLGTLTFQLPSSVMSSVEDEFGIFDMPYIIADRDHMRRVEAKILPLLEAAADRQGYKILAIWENGFRNITNNVRPVVVPQDLKGLKLRTPKGKWRVRMFEAYGANPTPMSLSEVFTALQTGVIDGQENPLSIIDGNKFYEVQQHVSLTRHVYTPAYVLVGKNAWEHLPEDVQVDLQRIARNMQDWVYETGERLDNELVGKLRDAGMKVSQIDREAFVAASQPIYSAFINEVSKGSELIKSVRAAE
ncbi:MAG: TRAP transporter substrate-binding protein [Pseudomonadales bacterium]